MNGLKHTFLQIETQKENCYGGNQKWFPYSFLRKSGCGVISAANVILYLKGKRRITQAEYMDTAKELWKYDLPVLPGIGMNGMTLALGMNRYFRRNKLPYRACWKLSGKKLLQRIDRQLAEEIPVILAIGPDFPKLWEHHCLQLYGKLQKDQFVPVVKTRAHYVTVTGREGQWFSISSWGKEYYIDLNELKTYIRENSSSLVSNMIYISKKPAVAKRNRKFAGRIEC